MLASKRVKGQEGILEFYRGTLIAQGTNGTNGAGSPTITVPAAVGEIQDFTDVQVGDRVYISGESTATVFLVTAPGLSPTSMTLDNAIVAAHTANAVWRVFRGGIDPSAVVDRFNMAINDYLFIYEIQDFGV